MPVNITVLDSSPRPGARTGLPANQGPSLSGSICLMAQEPRRPLLQAGRMLPGERNGA